MREAGRLEASIKLAVESGVTPIVFLHYPPVYAEFVCEEIIEILQKYQIRQVYYGHIHGKGIYNTVSEYGGIKLTLTACDGVDFTPVYISRCEMFKKI